MTLPHRKTAPVIDRIALRAGGDALNVLVLSQEPGQERCSEANFSGEGRLIELLARRFPGGWFGGALPERGYWGHSAPVPDGLVPFLIKEIQLIHHERQENR